MADSDTTGEVLSSRRRSRDSYQSEAAEVRARLQTMLEEENPDSLDMVDLSETLEDLDTTSRLGSEDIFTLQREETDEDLKEADKGAKKLFKSTIHKAKSLGKMLIFIRAVHEQIQTMDKSLTSMETKTARDPSMDYHEGHQC